MLSGIEVRENEQEAFEELFGETWDDPSGAAIRMVRGLLNRSMVWECTRYVGAQWYGREAGRVTHRNGYYRRTLDTTLGPIELRVPRTRDGQFHPESLSRYQRRHVHVDSGIREMFIAGVSTRRVRDVLAPLIGVDVSASTVSEVAKSLTAEVCRFHERRLPGDLKYLFLDAVYVKVKSATKPARKAVLVAYGVDAKGVRQVLDFRMESSESENCWERFLWNLIDRGVAPDSVKLVLVDGCQGLVNAVRRCFPNGALQRCWVHKMWNVLSVLPRAKERYQPVIQGLRDVYEAGSLREGRRRLREWARRWRHEFPKAVECVERDADELLSFLSQPTSLHRKLRTTNVIERCFREVRRRSRTMGCFEDADSAERVLYAVFERLNRQWACRPLPTSTQHS
jgi:transposase-like protein